MQQKKSSHKRVAILGCGPSGLVAAEAVNLVWPHADVVIWSRKQKSPMKGAQFLHEPVPVPGAPEIIGTLTYETTGTAEDYKQKVYGDADVPFVSFSNVENGEQVPAWDIRAVYDRLWERWESRIIDTDLTTSEVSNILNVYRPHLMVSSVPAPILCYQNHSFQSEAIWATGEKVDHDRNLIVYEGDPKVKHYRVSEIFGWRNIEWPGRLDKPDPKAVKVKKPIKTDCNCFEGVLRVGRYGAWRKRDLVHHAWQDVVGRLREDEKEDMDALL